MADIAHVLECQRGHREDPPVPWPGTLGSPALGATRTETPSMNDATTSTRSARATPVAGCAPTPPSPAAHRDRRCATSSRVPDDVRPDHRWRSDWWLALVVGRRRGRRSIGVLVVTQPGGQRCASVPADTTVADRAPTVGARPPAPVVVPRPRPGPATTVGGTVVAPVTSPGRDRRTAVVASPRPRRARRPVERWDRRR